MTPVPESETGRLARFLVELWLLLEGQSALESGLDRDRCTEEAASALEFFEGHGVETLEITVGNAISRSTTKASEEMSNVVALVTADGHRIRLHPVAALRVVDRLLAASVKSEREEQRRKSGLEGQPRRVDLAPDLAYYVVPRWTGRKANRLAASQPGQRDYWLEWHQVIPAEHREIRVNLSAEHRSIQQVAELGKVSVLVGGFADEVHPDWSAKSPFRCHCLEDAEKRWQSVELLLEEAASRQVHLVVLPELTIDLEVRFRIQEWLQERSGENSLRLVVAGSFHEGDDGHPDGSLPRRNRAYVFDRHGEVVLVHTKLRPMRTTDGEWPVDEDVEGGRDVELLYSDIGLVGVAICLDYCEIGNTPVTDLWREIGPALMLVPSMGGDSTNHAHAVESLRLARVHGTTTLVASQPPEPNGELSPGKSLSTVGVGLVWKEAKMEPLRASPVFRGTIDLSES